MAKQPNKPQPPKRKRSGRSGLYWTLFALCTIASFGGGFWFTYRGTQVSIKEPPVGLVASTTSVPQDALAANAADAASSSHPAPLVTPAPVDPFAVSDATADAGSASTKATPLPDSNQTDVPPDANPAPDASVAPDAQAPDQAADSSKVYRVQVGSYDSQTAAQSMVDELSAAGVHSVAVQDASGQYHAQIGAYAERDRALSVADEVNAKGYSVTIRQ